MCVCRGVLAWERECDTGSVPEERKRERGGEQDEEKEVGGGRDTHRERNRHQIHCFHCLIRSAVRERKKERMEGRGRKMRSNMRRLERDSQTFLPRTEVQRRRWNDLRRKVKDQQFVLKIPLIKLSPWCFSFASITSPESPWASYCSNCCVNTSANLAGFRCCSCLNLHVRLPVLCEALFV